MTEVPRGWSKQGAEFYGTRRPDCTPDEPCYFCGVDGCEECGAVPPILAVFDCEDED